MLQIFLWPIRLPLLLLAAILRWLILGRFKREGVVEWTLDGSTSVPVSVRVERLERVVAILKPDILLVKIFDVPGGWAGLEQQRQALKKIRDEGTKVVVALEDINNASAYVSSAANKVIMTPLGEWAAWGIGIRLSFVGDALARLGIRVDIESAGAYKSAGERFAKAWPSVENREVLEALASDLQEGLISAIASGRGMEYASVEELLHRAPLGSEEALKAGLIDEIAYEDSLDELVNEELETPRKISFKAAWGWIRFIQWCERFGAKVSLVSVVHLQGPVMSARGQNYQSQIAARDVCGVIRGLKKDDRVAAVVLAINSPGGSALASDLIWREVEQLSQTKPVLAWLGDVAASGGYYIAAGAAHITACPGTLTGSIGVIGGKPVWGPALARIGVHTQWITRGENANIYSTDAGFTTRQRAIFKARLKSTYQVFLQRVAAGRRCPVRAIEPLAEGRVWTGRQALENGLVDELEGLSQCIKRAGAMGRLLPGDPWEAVHLLPGQPSWWRRRFSPAIIRGWLLPGGLGPVMPTGGVRLLLEHPGEMLTLLPVELDIR